jgi:hypothetical protein
MKLFGEIRIEVLKNWNEGLIRHRKEGEFSDDYSESDWCKIQEECTNNGKHCSFICSLGDWLDNISDLLYDSRFDNLSVNDYEILFRYYTRILLLVSEVVEDFVMLNDQIWDFHDKKKASRDLEKGILINEELKNLSEFINTVCKHKTEKNNLHVHNHHLKIEFVDFGAVEHENQIRFNRQNWMGLDKDTTILMPTLNYFIGLIIKTNNKVLSYIQNNPAYKNKMFERYADEWSTSDVED